MRVSEIAMAVGCIGVITCAALYTRAKRPQAASLTAVKISKIPIARLVIRGVKSCPNCKQMKLMPRIVGIFVAGYIGFAAYAGLAAVKIHARRMELLEAQDWAVRHDGAAA